MATYSNSSAGTDVHLERERIVNDAGPDVPLVTVAEYLEHWLPKTPLLDVTVLDIIDKVTHSKAYARGRWTAFPRDPANVKHGHEDDIYASLAQVVSAIQEAAIRCAPGVEPTTCFVTNPKKPPVAVERDAHRTRPDAYFVYKDPHRYSPHKPVHWLDIIATGEFKRHENYRDTQDDLEKALGHIHQVNREDARRRRLFAFTIEDRMMRLWYADHSAIAVSRVFDFFSEPEYFIRFALGFLYASHENLGFDQSITTNWNGKKGTRPQYVITVHSRTDPNDVRQYKTIKLLSGIGAEAIRGRGTRVWEVKEVKKGRMSGSPLVLKDCWIDSDREVEGVVIERLKKSARKAADKAALDDMLLTTVVDGKVLLTDGTPEHTFNGDARKLLITENPYMHHIARIPAPFRPPSSERYNPDPPIKATQPAGDHRTPGDGLNVGKQAVVYSEKDRYRIVFREVCQVLHEIQDLSRVVYALMGACTALQVLHRLGWVHRDISAGNILLCGDTVKIADFEYAKKVSESKKGTNHTIRTGTADFMSVEVVSRNFAFGPKRRKRKILGEQDYKDVYKTLGNPNACDPESMPTPNTTASPLWFYNPLHDMESILWLFLFFILTKDIVCKPLRRPAPKKFTEKIEARNERILQYSNLAHALFTVRSMDRALALQSDSFLEDHFHNYPLHPTIRPLVEAILQMRYALTDAYEKAEQSVSTIDHTSADGVHMEFAAWLVKAQKHIRDTGCQLTLRPLSEEARKLPPGHLKQLQIMLKLASSSSSSSSSSLSSVASTTKRSREDETEDEGEEDSESRHSKSPRTSIDQASPHPTRRASRKVRAVAPPKPAATATTTGGPRNRIAAVPIAVPGVPAHGRVLRSRTRKEAAAETSALPSAPPTPPAPTSPAVRRSQRTRMIAERKGKPTKNDQASKAAAKSAAKMKNKTGKGR